jgi:deazaflavin-dependent oxidoreductase (nitroreductase family)
MTEEVTDYNQQMIERFRANGGKMGAGPMSMLLLTTTGAKSGRMYVTPLGAFADNGRLFVIASYAGKPKNPAWYYNLVANPTVTVEYDGDTFDATARVLPDDERDPLFARIVEAVPQFGEYQQKTSRKIPLVELERSNAEMSA